MKINLALILSIILAVGLVALGFTAFQVCSERQKLYTEMEAKANYVAEDFYTIYFKTIEEGDSIHLKKITENIIKRYGFSGIVIYFTADSIIFLNDSVKPFFQN